jgi:hypothetical protein
VRLTIYIIFLVLLSGCTTTTIVNNCPPWLEVGTVDIENDTETTKRWIFRYETNRIRECNKK